MHNRHNFIEISCMSSRMAEPEIFFKIKPSKFFLKKKSNLRMVTGEHGIYSIHRHGNTIHEGLISWWAWKYWAIIRKRIWEHFLTHYSFPKNYSFVDEVVTELHYWTNQMGGEETIWMMNTDRIFTCLTLRTNGHVNETVWTKGIFSVHLARKHCFLWTW